jgi:hypothetical protein
MNRDISIFRKMSSGSSAMSGRIGSDLQKWRFQRASSMLGLHDHARPKTCCSTTGKLRKASLATAHILLSNFGRSEFWLRMLRAVLDFFLAISRHSSATLQAEPLLSLARSHPPCRGRLRTPTQSRFSIGTCTSRREPHRALWQRIAIFDKCASVKKSNVFGLEGKYGHS